MKKRMITLLTLGGALARARDRKGAYTLRYVNKLPKFGLAARAAAAAPAATEPPPASPAPPAAPRVAPSEQPALFAAPKAPATPAAPKTPANRSLGSLSSLSSLESERTERTEKTERTKTTESPPTPVPPARPSQPAAPKARFLPFAKLSAAVAAVFAVVPKTAARVRGRLRSPSADSRPRAQAELALEKVTVLRNDLSDADLVVVTVQPKTEDSRPAQAPEREPAGSPWMRVASRWAKQKKTAPAESGAQAEHAQDRAQTPC